MESREARDGKGGKKGEERGREGGREGGGKNREGWDEKV
jgi:hypothetical protein